MQNAEQLEQPINRVLLVADNETIGTIVREQLATAGYEVHWARNRVQASGLWQPSVYRVVFVDLRKDPDEGASFAAGIRATDPGQRIVFLKNGRNGTNEAA